MTLSWNTLYSALDCILAFKSILTGFHNGGLWENIYESMRKYNKPIHFELKNKTAQFLCVTESQSIFEIV